MFISGIAQGFEVRRYHAATPITLRITCSDKAWSIFFLKSSAFSHERHSQFLLVRYKVHNSTQHNTMEEDEEISPTQEIEFCTMGMFIIGENEARVHFCFSSHLFL